MSDDDKALDLAELRRVAEANSDTQWEREWWKHHAADYWQTAMGGRPYLRDYLTLIDPPTVLALLDRLEKAEGDWFDVCAELRESQRQALAWQVRAVGAEAERDEACDWQARAEAAEAKVARVEALADTAKRKAAADRDAVENGGLTVGDVARHSLRADQYESIERSLRAALRGDA